MNRRLLSIGLIFALSACGGGGGGNGLPSTGTGTGTGTGSGSTQNVTVKFSVPSPTSTKAIARGRHYVSYSTALAVVTYTQNGSTFTEPVSGVSSQSNYVTDVSEATGSANSATPGKACVNTVAGGPARTCTIDLAIPTGIYSVELSLWSGSYADAHTPEGDKLSASSHAPLTIAAGSTNSINFAVAGINAVVSSVYLLLDHSTVNWNTGSAVDLSIDLKDAEGNHIMSDGTGNGLVDPSGNTYTAHITLNTTQINGCTPSGTLADINGAAPPYDVTAPPSGTVPVTQNDPCLYALTVTSSDPPNGTNSITNAPLQTSGVNQTYSNLTGISDARATTLDDKGRIWVFGTPASPGNGGIERINSDGSVDNFSAASGDNPVNAVEGTDGNMYIVNNDANLTYLPVNAAAGTTPSIFPLTLSDPGNMKFVAIARDSATGHLWMADSTDGSTVELGGSPYIEENGSDFSLGSVGATAIDVSNGTVFIGDNIGELWGFPASNEFLNFSAGVATSPLTGLSAFDSASEIVTSTAGYDIYQHSLNNTFAGSASSQVSGIRAKDGNLYFAGSSGIQEASFNGSSFTNGGTFNNNFPSATFGNPTIDLNGNLWFAVNGTGSVMEFSPPANWSSGGGFIINARRGH